MLASSSGTERGQLGINMHHPTNTMGSEPPLNSLTTGAAFSPARMSARLANASAARVARSLSLPFHAAKV